MAKRSKAQPQPAATVSTRVSEIQAEIDAIGDPDVMLARFVEKYRKAKQEEIEGIPALRNRAHLALLDMRTAEADAAAERKRLAQLRAELARHAAEAA